MRDIKFTFGQEVWFIHQGIPSSGCVAAVTLCPLRHVYRIEIASKVFASVDQDGLFASREALANGLREQANKIMEAV